VQRGLALLVVLTLVLTGSPASAQRIQADLSGTRVDFDTVATLNSASVSPLIEWQTQKLFTSLTGSFTGFEDGEWAAQGRGDISLLAAPLGALSPFRMELLGIAKGSYHTADFRTASTRGEFRLHAGGRQVGGWVGVVGARGWASGTGDVIGGAGPTAGLWGRQGTTRAALMFTRLRIEGFWFPELNARVSTVAGPVEVLAYGGWRDGATGSTVEASAWGGGTISWWVARNMALVAGAGSYPSDLLEALPRGRYVSVGLRIATRRSVVPSIKPLGRPVYEREEETGLLRFMVGVATRVEVVGDWTGWKPLVMQRAPDGAWVLRTVLPSGVYRFNLVIDGDRWIVPEGVPTVDDGFGSQSGLLIVP